MPAGTTPDMLVVVDERPGSLAALRVASHYARGTVALTSWGAAPLEVEVDCRSSIAAQPTIAEAFRLAAQQQIGWLGLRRDFAEPAALLGELLVATGRHADDDIPGFAVFLASTDPTPFRRILAIVDHRSGPVSGLLAYAAVAVADTARAVLDVLVIGAEGQSLASEDEVDLLAISREQELLDRAIARATESDVTINWLPAAEVTAPWWVIRDQLSQHDYDLVIDDLGDLTLGGRVGTARSVEEALAPGNVGDIPLRLLRETDLPLLLVIDEIRLGIAPRRILGAGTVAALSLGMVSAAAMSVSAPTVAAQGVLDPDPVDSLAGELEEALNQAVYPDADASTTRRRDSEDASRGQSDSGGRVAAMQAATAQQPAVIVPASSTDQDSEEAAEAEQEKKGAQEPKPPKGGATPKDVAKVRAKASKAKAALAEDREARDEAAAELAEAAEQLDSTKVDGYEALADLQAARVSLDAANSYAEQTRQGTTGISALLPGGPTVEQADFADQVATSAQENLDDSATVAAGVLTGLTAAQEEVARSEEALAEAKAKVEEAQEKYADAKATVEVYRESLAETRQSPVAKSNYRLTARFGDTGWHWSSGVHTGLDFAGSTGTDVMAAASGTVVEAGWAGAYGNRIVVDHGDGYSTTYNHLSATRVSVGDKVRTGDHIGDLGGTGNVTGPHLHFEVTKGEKMVDPEEWLGW